MTDTLKAVYNDYVISITQQSADQIIDQLNKRGTPNAYIRLGLKGAGCNGFQPILQFDDATKHKDYIFDFITFKVLIDPKSIVYLSGMTLEWKQTLMKQGFEFNLPNKTGECGCGKSVNF